MFLPDVVTPCYTGAPLFSSFISQNRDDRVAQKMEELKYKVLCLSVSLLFSSILPVLPLALFPHYFRETDSVVGIGASR